MRSDRQRRIFVKEEFNESKESRVTDTNAKKIRTNLQHSVLDSILTIQIIVYYSVTGIKQ
jgi:hypothetical protein